MQSGPNSHDVASLTERAYQAISTAINTMELKPGELLTQDRLARWLAISRTPVREALRRLEQDGIIQSQPGRGLVVAELTIRDVEEMLDLLRLLDTRAAELAALRRSAAQAEQLMAAAHAMQLAAERHDLVAWNSADRPYHEILQIAADNQLLSQMIRDVRRRLHRISFQAATQPAHLLDCTREHMQIAAAIVRGDPQAAAAQMRAHIDALGQSALTLIRTYIMPLRGERF